MGIRCSSEADDNSDNVERHFRGQARKKSKLIKESSPGQLSALKADDNFAEHNMEDSQYNLVSALDDAVAARSGRGAQRRGTILDSNQGPVTFLNPSDYARQREEVVARENVLAFDYLCTTKASPLEIRANQVLQAVRKDDQVNVYDKAPYRRGYGGQEHPRFMGDHFLSNVDLIEQTKLFRVACEMPKGAHLHIHFNANLPPEVLVNIAKGMDRMFITSDIPLAPLGDEEKPPGYYDKFYQCRIQFSILTPEKERPGNLFHADYPERGTMRFKDFLREFDGHFSQDPRIGSADEWLRNKLIFHEEEAHNWLQTAQGAWDKFNARTQMMKGLFNYEQAYRRYTRLCLQEFVDDKIQYAEIRPNFMETNQLWANDGTRQINNAGIVELIIEEYDRFQSDNRGVFGGLKIIYCTPRSSSREAVRYSLDECLAFKKRWPQWIAGYDILGEESKGQPLKAFIPEFLDFKRKCAEANLDIPFLFHCGETLEMGGDTDGNLVDAVLLGARRIGHGFALPRHPYVLEQMKKHRVCVELCPISNEILGLTPRIGGHAMYSLLARNVPCTLSTDNGTLFRSRLSHDFYQAFVGRTDSTLHGWRQLIEWSIEHSCMEPPLRRDVYAEWERRWDEFCGWIVEEYGYLLEGE